MRKGKETSQFLWIQMKGPLSEKEVKRYYKRLLSSLSVGTPHYQEGYEGWSDKYQFEQIPIKTSYPHPSVRRTLFTPTRLCPTALDIIRVTLNIVRNSKNSQRLVSWESSINIPTPPMTLSLSLDHLNLLVLKLIFSISKGQKHSTLKLPLQVLDLGMEWSQDPNFVCECHLQAHIDTWILILYACYYWSFAPRRLEIALELPLCVVSLEKFILPLYDSEQLKVWFLWSLEWGKGWERPNSLWAHRWGRKILCESEPRDKILCLLSLCVCLLCCCYIYLLVEPIL
jgi:hypothetical protein